MNSCFRTFFLSIVFSFFFTKSNSQQSFFKNSSFGIQGSFGSFLTMQPKAVYLRDSYSYFGEVYFQRINPNWSTIKKPIDWGASLFFGNTGSQQYLGNMGGIFPFINMPVFTAGILKSKFRAGAGLGWIQRPYDKVSNHKNILIGSPINACINFLWQNEIKISPQLHVDAGLSFTHLSNGASRLPNLGINIPAISVGLHYAAHELPITRTSFPDSFYRKLSFAVYTSAGLKQQPWIGSKQYLVNIFQAEVTRRFSYNNQYGGGIVLFYDRSMQVNPYTITSDKRENKNVQLGVYASYEHFFGRFSLPLQMNVYVYNRDIYSTLFQQVGLRYKLTDHWLATAMLKTHGGKADVIHLGMGYKLN